MGKNGAQPEQGMERGARAWTEATAVHPTAKPSYGKHIFLGRTTEAGSVRRAHAARVPAELSV